MARHRSIFLFKCGLPNGVHTDVSIYGPLPSKKGGHVINETNIRGTFDGIWKKLCTLV